MRKYSHQAKIEYLSIKRNLIRLLENPNVQNWTVEDMSCTYDGGTLAPVGNPGFDHTSNKYSVYRKTKTETKNNMPTKEGRVWWHELSNKEGNCHEVRLVISDREGRGSNRKHLKGLELDGLSALIPHDTLFKRDSKGKHVYLTNNGDRFELTEKNLELFMRYLEC